MNTYWIFLVLPICYGGTGNYVLLEDLTWPVDNKTVNWPTTQPFVYKKQVTGTNIYGWYALNEFCVGEHVGTHLDAPYHFNEDGWKVGDIPLQHLFGNAVVINVEHKQETDGALAEFLPEDITAWESRNGEIKNGSVVFVKFGWAKYYGTKKYMHGTDEEELNFPSISEDAAKLLVERHVYGVGLDTSSVDRGNSTSNASHRVFAMNNIYILENVKLTSNLTEIGMSVVVLPMNLREGTGAPVRIVTTKSVTD